MNAPLKIGFMGSGQFASRCLELISARIRPQWVVTNAPRAAGRGKGLRNTPVFEKAGELSLRCLTTEKLSADAELLEWIKANLPDAILVIDFGHIVKEPLLSLPPLGCINIHPSRLPQYRGSAPVQRALMDGLTSTAVSVFRLDPGMDSGPLLAQPELPIADDDNAESLFEMAAVTGTETLLHYLLEVPSSEWNLTPQKEDGVSAAPKIDKSEGKIDWLADAKTIVNLIRGIGEAPGVFTSIRGRRLRLYSAETVKSKYENPGRFFSVDGYPAVSCGSGALLLREVQPEGKKRQPASEWARGARLTEGEELREDA